MGRYVVVHEKKHFIIDGVESQKEANEKFAAEKSKYLGEAEKGKETKTIEKTTGNDQTGYREAIIALNGEVKDLKGRCSKLEASSDEAAKYYESKFDALQQVYESAITSLKEESAKSLQDLKDALGVK